MPDKRGALSADFLRNLEAFTLTARRSFQGMRAGMHRSLKRGTGLEFSDYRQYEPGDNPRHIDWGVYGRTDRLYVKRFLEEENLQVLVIVDASASMTVDSDKWEFARRFALGISYIALTNQDRVRLLPLGESPSPFLNGPKAIHEADRFLAATNLSRAGQAPQQVILHSLQKALSTIRFPGIVIFISDFLFDTSLTERIILSLAAKNLEIHFTHVLGQSDVNPFPELESAVVKDEESEESFGITLNSEARERYASLLGEHERNLRDLCSRRRISYAKVNLNQDFNSQIFSAISDSDFIQ